jgi:hypothetical protein
VRFDVRKIARKRNDDGSDTSLGHDDLVSAKGGAG